MMILVVNTGSTSIKLETVEMGQGMATPLHGERYQTDGAGPEELLAEFLTGRTPPDAVVHRVVHGGRLVESHLISAAIEAEIESLSNLAPLHNPVALSWIAACRRKLSLPQVAVFDTAFFAALPAAAKSYALPPDLTEQYGIRRYGFHGIAHRAMWRRWVDLRSDLPHGGRLITVQLGGGCSITATREGTPQDTSMGFSPTEGLVMATRCGDIDPGAILTLLRQKDMTPDLVERLINERSGLLGLSGRSADMRNLIDASDPQARLAVDLYCHRLRKYIGAYQAVLGGVDGIAFGGGVGENMPGVRARALENMQWCGIDIDAEVNNGARGSETRISTDDSRVDVRVVPVDETAILAEEAYAVLTGQEGMSS